MILEGWIFAAHRLEFTGMTKDSYHERHISLKSVVECVSLPSNIRHFDFYLSDFPKNASALELPRLSELKKHQCQQTRLLFSQVSKNGTADAEERLSPGGARRKRAKTVIYYERSAKRGASSPWLSRKI